MRAVKYIRASIPQDITRYFANLDWRIPIHLGNVLLNLYCLLTRRGLLDLDGSSFCKDHKPIKPIEIARAFIMKFKIFASR